jgi:GDP-4-dehydro-6-deoxy-D-mannose reductase
VGRSLVTGADGFVGQHLIAELLERGEEVVGAVLRVPPDLSTLPSGAAERVEWVAVDLRDRDTVEAVTLSNVDRVYHLAALSSARKSLEDPVSAFQVNTIGTLYLLEALTQVRRHGDCDPVILIPGSAEVYGSAALRHVPLLEESPLEPLTPYAVSKAAQEMLVLQYHRAEGLQVVVTRSFNHTGPGQHRTFVASQLAGRVQAIRSQGGEGAIEVGNLEIRRDFTDVRDVVRAYVALAERGESGQVYNVCSGRSYSIGELLTMLIDLAGVKVEVKLDPRLARPVDVPEMVGSNARLAERTGWEPRIDMSQSLADLLAAQGQQ